MENLELKGGCVIVTFKNLKYFVLEDLKIADMRDGKYIDINNISSKIKIVIYKDDIIYKKKRRKN